jgi:hypothetical protein
MDTFQKLLSSYRLARWTGYSRFAAMRLVIVEMVS